MCPGSKSPALRGNKNAALARRTASAHQGCACHTRRMRVAVARSEMILASTRGFFAKGGLAQRFLTDQLWASASTPSPSCDRIEGRRAPAGRQGDAKGAGDAARVSCSRTGAPSSHKRARQSGPSGPVRRAREWRGRCGASGQPRPPTGAPRCAASTGVVAAGPCVPVSGASHPAREVGGPTAAVEWTGARPAAHGQA